MSKQPPIPLSALQKWMQQAIIGPSSVEQRSPQVFLPEDWQGRNLDSIIKPSNKLSSRQHLNIYQQSYILRLRACMASQFKALEYALGETLFEGFVDEYLQAHPSESYTLTDLGAHFAAFLEATRPDKEQSEKEDWPDFMIELARFEYQINLLFDVPEEPFTPADFSPPDETLRLIPVFELFAHQYPIRWFYSEFSKGNNPELPLPEPTYCLILRKKLRLAFYDLTQEQYQFLRSFQQTGSVETAKLEISDADNRDDIWQDWKRHWTGLGFFQLFSQRI
jgi:hypothetical protein